MSRRVACFGMAIASVLQVQGFAFLLDHLALINCMHNSPQDNLPDWRIRHAVADMRKMNNQIQGSFYNIPRDENIITDTLARNVHILRKAALIFICSNYRHNGSCPFKEKKNSVLGLVGSNCVTSLAFE